MHCDRVASRWRGSSLKPGQAGEVVDEIGHADLGAGADHADGAHDQPEAAFLGGEDMLDPRAHPGAGGIAAGDVRRHLASSGLLALELRLEAAALEQGQVRRRAIGGIGPHIAGGVVAIEHRAELAAVICRRMGDGIAPQKAVLAVDADMVLVAEHRHRDLGWRLWPSLGGGLALACRA